MKEPLVQRRTGKPVSTGVPHRSHSRRVWIARDESGTLHGFVDKRELRRVLAALAGSELVAELARSI